MNLVEKAFSRLYPGKEFDYDVSVDYSRRFKPYNANVRIRGRKLEFNLSKEWSKVNDEIQIGLIQSLLLKILKGKGSTTNIDLYNLFIKKLHISIPKLNIDPVLSESFDRVNEKYFYGLVEKSNLEWGNSTTTKLGSYDYQTDTITISSIFKGEDDLLDYVMYHEMLHKKHKYRNVGNRSMHHTGKFKQKEKEFEDYREMELGIKKLIRKNKRRNIFGF
ncbi:hypothetical protein KY345_03225 [Candidatus Woesearchaeota archaeon]|nr:hypothetical protein [Candidatus Woesearchaeota archaeon]